MKQEDITAFNKLKDAIIIISAEDLKQAIRECLKEEFSMTNNPPKQDELIGTAEACKILGCCPRTMQRYRDLRLFNITMIGPHKALYYRSEILAFRENNLRKKR